jgi:hypothetical protein
MPENFHFRDSLGKATVSGGAGSGDVSAKGSASIDVGRVGLSGQIDPEHLTAEGEAKAGTVEVSASGQVHTPVGDAGGDAHAEGPSAEAQGKVGPGGIQGTVGVGAGSAGADVSVDALGQRWGVGADVGLKAELGLQLGPTSRIDLPLVSLEGPNPVAGAVVWGEKAVENLVSDPGGTVEDAANDVVDTATQAVESFGETIGIGGGDSDNEHGAVMADRDQAAEWESFNLLQLDGGHVALLSWQGFFSAQMGGGAGVYANRPQVGEWETWTLIGNGDSTVSFQTSNGHFLCAEEGGGRECQADRTSIGDWEKFQLVNLPDGKVALRTRNAGKFVSVQP